MKAISSAVAAILIVTISITLVGTTYFFSQGVLKGTTAEAFEVIDVFSNKIIVRNIGTQKINNFTVLIDGKAINAKIEQPVEPGSIGTVELNLTDVPAGRHELVIISKSMSQRWTWEFQYVTEATTTTTVPTTTTTTFSEQTATEKTEGGGKLITIQTGLGKLLTDWVVNSQVNSSTCTEGSPCVYSQYQIITANATVKCSNPGSTCGSITSGIRYNDTGNVMKLIDKTKGATPMYVLEGGDDYYDKYIYSWWNFSTASQITGNPTGIAYNGTHFLVTRYTTPNVYIYNKTGDYVTSFSCSGQDSYLQGIDVNETHIFVVGSGNKAVYAYNMAGTYTGWSFSVSGQITVPSSVVYNGTYFWVASSSLNNYYVYRYRADGTYDNWRFQYNLFGTVLGNGLEFNGTHFFISTSSNYGRVYAYNITGNYTGWNFTTNTTPTTLGIAPYGLAYSESEKNFYTVDYTDKYVRRYTRNSTLGFFKDGDVKQVNYTVNITSDSGVYKIDINFTSDVLENSTKDAIIRVGSLIPSPKYFDNSTNNTVAGKPTEFRLRWTDDNGLSGYTFSLDNCTGSFVNQTINGKIWQSMTGTENWSNVSLKINSTANCTIRWKVYANNTLNNWGISDTFSFTTLPTYCDYSIQQWQLPYTISQNNKYYCLASDEYIGGQTAINFSSGIQNSTLDCLNYKLKGNGTEWVYGVQTSNGVMNVTIKNCNITEFSSGININETGYNITIYNNNISISRHLGLEIYCNYCNITNNRIFNSTDTGIELHYNGNTLTSNTVDERYSEIGYGIEIYNSSNMLYNNTIYSKYMALILYGPNTENNNISGGSVMSSISYDYDIYPNKSSNFFRNTNFTVPRVIMFRYGSTNWFNYNNRTDIELWLKTNISSTATITRKLINWNQSLMQWNDSASLKVTTGYNITGLKQNTNYNIYNNSILVTTLNTDNTGSLNFTINMSSGYVHEIKVQEITIPPGYLIINSNETKPIYSPPNYVKPEENSTVNMNITVNVTNSTSLDKCIVRIFDSHGSYSSPIFGPDNGTIQINNNQVQCFYSWAMGYWQNPGDWNVSVDLNLTTGLKNFTSFVFNYLKIYSVMTNVTFINFTGSPGQTVNSTTAYPMKMKNTGNTKLNISINGSDLIGETDTSKVINVDNVTYNETETGIFENLTKDYVLVFSFFSPVEENFTYFRAYIPPGFKAQMYNNTIGIKGEES